MSGLPRERAWEEAYWTGAADAVGYRAEASRHVGRKDSGTPRHMAAVGQCVVAQGTRPGTTSAAVAAVAAVERVGVASGGPSLRRWLWVLEKAWMSAPI